MNNLKEYNLQPHQELFRQLYTGLENGCVAALTRNSKQTSIIKPKDVFRHLITNIGDFDTLEQDIKDTIIHNAKCKLGIN